MSQTYQQNVDLTIQHNVKCQTKKHNFDFDHSSSAASSKSNPDRKNYLNKVIPVQRIILRVIPNSEFQIRNIDSLRNIPI